MYVKKDHANISCSELRASIATDLSNFSDWCLEIRIIVNKYSPLVFVNRLCGATAAFGATFYTDYS